MIGVQSEKQRRQAERAAMIIDPTSHRRCARVMAISGAIRARISQQEVDAPAADYAALAAIPTRAGLRRSLSIWSLAWPSDARRGPIAAHQQPPQRRGRTCDAFVLTRRFLGSAPAFRSQARLDLGQGLFGDVTFQQHKCAPRHSGFTRAPTADLTA
jgi:hypothetical protein